MATGSNGSGGGGGKAGKGKASPAKVRGYQRVTSSANNPF